MTDIDQSSSTPAADIRADETLARMIQGIGAARYGAGAALLRQDETSDTAYVLAEGTVKVVADTAYGVVPLATIHAPSLLGEIGALSGVPRTASIIAETAITVHAIPRHRLVEAASRDTQFLISIIAQLGRQLHGMNRTLSLYSKALEALQQREFDPRILEDLVSPSPPLLEFSVAFRNFAQEINSKRRGQDEVASAAVIQQSFLPRPALLEGSSHRLDLHAEMRPARNIGGDFYDYFFLDEDRLAIVVGDVCGKGIPASLFMSVVMTVLRVAAREEKDPAATIARTNDILCRDNVTSMFATAFYGVLDLRDGALEYCNCGHNAPLLLDEAGNVTSLPATGLPLALYPERSAAARRITVTPRDLLVLFTDGVTEAMSPTNEEFSERRLEEALRAARGLSAREIVAHITSRVESFAAEAEQADDITCMVIRRTDEA